MSIFLVDLFTEKEEATKKEVKKEKSTGTCKIETNFNSSSHEDCQGYCFSVSKFEKRNPQLSQQEEFLRKCQ